jgi:hypothetical protein
MLAVIWPDVGSLRFIGRAAWLAVKLKLLTAPSEALMCTCPGAALSAAWYVER